ncbi:nucleotidyltransferase domain-containing protein [Candidatus Parcubacteria bacterium]|nr:nucleotidyltransferase domain-containing protein [Patescibacteria group bacterium]MCG2688879.1 nucleotidyltransferase domain-containing protein [Candidatus Parcubacteria bacterium]
MKFKLEKINEHLTKLANEYVIENLKKQPSVEGVFLIGSVARNQACLDSDIDLLIVSNKKLSNDQQDNMSKDVFKDHKISLIYTNIDKIKKNISDGIVVDACFAKEAVPLYDPKNMIIEIKEIANNFKLDINLKSRINNAEDGLNDAIRYEKNNRLSEATAIALTNSFFFIRGFIQSFNSPYTSAKHMLGELNNIDKNLSKSYERMWKLGNLKKILKEFRYQIDYTKKHYL